jgi:CxxC-x17-CxxC domain-containing protein
MSWQNHKFRIEDIYRPAKDNLFKSPGAPSIFSIEVLTHGGQKTDFRTCKCSECGIEAMASLRTPFRPKGDKNGPLLCNRCYNKEN